MKRHGIVGIQGIDTRSLVRHLRDHGSQEGIISTVNFDPAELVAKAKASPGLIGLDLVKNVTCAEAYDWNQGMWGSTAVTSSAMAAKSQAARKQEASSRSGFFRRRLRFWHQVQHPAQSRRGRLPG